MNCFQSSGPLRGDKRDLTEGGIRVPFIARWPGTIPVNQTSDEVIAFQDMLPTFAELAGVTPPQGIDGISVVKALQGGKIDSSREFLYWDYGHCRRRYDQAVRGTIGKGFGLERTVIFNSTTSRPMPPSHTISLRSIPALFGVSRA